MNVALPSSPEEALSELLNAIDSPACSVDRRGRVTVVNGAWTRFSAANGGDQHQDPVGADYFVLCSSVTGAGLLAAQETAVGLRGVLDGDQRAARFEQRCPSPDEPERWFSLRITRLPDEHGAALVYVDVSSEKAAAERAVHERLHDPLTGLPTRSLLLDRLGQALKLGVRQHRRVAVAVIDLDRFARISDTVGQAAGDIVLKDVAQRLTSALLGDETLARMGSDEFALLLGSVDSPQAASARVRTVLESLAPPLLVNGSHIVLTATAGLAVATTARAADDLLADACSTMREAKLRQPGQLGTPHVAGRQQAVVDLAAEGDMRQSLLDGDFEVFYQPIADLSTGRVSGVEALVRWRLDGVLRAPDTFIALAEATGMIVPLGAWVFSQACEQVVEWEGIGLDLDMAINLSVRQMAQPDLLETLLSSVRRSGVDPRRLTVEVTESTVMEEASAQAALRGIDAFGASIAVDDFGVGYSSLLYLKQYPIRALKVDRSFVAGLGRNTDDDAIVASVIQLARSVGAVSIAEGVERRDQLEVLQDLGCRFVQGFLLSPAVPADQLPSVAATCDVLLAGLMSRPYVSPSQDDVDARAPVVPATSSG